MDKQERAIAELKRIEAELAKMAALQKRRDYLRQYIELDRILFAERAADDARQDSMDVPMHKPRAVLNDPPELEERPRREFTKDRILTGARRLIAANGPMQSADLISALEKVGVVIGGADKVLTVSSILSRAKDQFKSDRAAGGWTLVSPHKEVTPPSAPTPAGS